MDLGIKSVEFFLKGLVLVKTFMEIVKTYGYCFALVVVIALGALLYRVSVFKFVTSLAEKLFPDDNGTADRSITSTPSEQEPRERPKTPCELPSTPCGQESPSPSEQESPVESELTEIQLDQVADKVRRSWQEIGTYLGYSYQQLQDYKMAHHDSMKDRLFSILCDWKTKEGKNATFVALVDACTKAKAGGAVKKILGVK